MNDIEPIKTKLKEILERYAVNRDDKVIYREKKVKITR